MPPSGSCSASPRPRSPTAPASYTSRGILTLNEARAALGRAPLADAAADMPMSLTGAGYVALGRTAEPTPAVQAPAKVAKVDVFDEDRHPRWPAGSSDHQGGRFAPSDTAAAASKETAQSNDCVKEWREARAKCVDLFEIPLRHPDRALMGGHTTINGCAKGSVSEICGGNRV